MSITNLIFSYTKSLRSINAIWMWCDKVACIGCNISPLWNWVIWTNFSNFLVFGVCILSFYLCFTSMHRSRIAHWDEKPSFFCTFYNTFKRKLKKSYENADAWTLEYSFLNDFTRLLVRSWLCHPSNKGSKTFWILIWICLPFYVYIKFFHI